MKQVVALALALGVSSALFAQQDYEIRLDRPLKPGDQFKISATGRKRQDIRISTANEPLHEKNDDFTIEYAARRKVFAVDEIGRAIKVSDTVQQLSLVRSGNRTEFLKPGTKVLGYVEGMKKVFEIDGRRADEETESVLELVIDITAGGPGNDEVFGSRTRKKVGEAWKMNSVAAIAELGRRNIEGQAIEGDVTLESVTHEPIGDVLRVVCHFKGNARPISMPGITSSSGPFQGTWSTKVPVNPALTSTEDSMAINLQFQGKGGVPGGGENTVSATLRESVIARNVTISN